MAAPYSDIQEKAEQAIQAVIIAAATGIPDAQVFTAFQSGADAAIGPTSVAITCEAAVQDVFGENCHRLSVRIEVMTNLDQSVQDEGGTEATDHSTSVAKVFDALWDDALSTSLTDAVSDFTVFNSIGRVPGSRRVENRKAISEMLLEFTAVPSDIAAA